MQVQKVNTETSGPPLHVGKVFKKQMLILTISLKVCVKFNFHMKPMLMRNRQERRQVKLKITKVSNTKLTAERALGSKSPESLFCYFLAIKDLFQTKELQPKLRHATEKHLQALWKKLAWKRWPETSETNLLVLKVQRPGKLGCWMLPSFQKLSVQSVWCSTLHCSVE